MKMIMALGLLGLATVLFGQTHNAVPLTEVGLYDFLNQAELRGFLSDLRTVKPYPRSYVIKVLKDLEESRPEMNTFEQEVFQVYYDRYVVDEDRDSFLDGDRRFENEEGFFRARVGVSLRSLGKIKATEIKDSGGEVLGSLDVTGDMGDKLSWGGTFQGGVFYAPYDPSTEYGPSAWEPYSYSKGWDGGIHPASSLNNFASMALDPSFGYRYNTEIVASLWDGRTDLRFGRLSREWGLGQGSLFLAGTAMPFMAFEGTVNPTPWLTLSFLTGTLEYGESYRNIEDYSIKKTAARQQNMYSLLYVELRPTDWLYLSVFDAGVYLKRPEMGYIHPLFSRFSYQNNVGDFDNMVLGGTLALRKPGLGRLYTSVFLDEARFNHDGFFTSFANMYSYQLGAEFILPGIPWGKGLLQYTKIEPYAYTHYAITNSPWYEGFPMETSYLNGGEPLGYPVEPNSDELLLNFNSQFKGGFKAKLGYRMTRHGRGPGGTFNPWGSQVNKDGFPAYVDPSGNIAYSDGSTWYDQEGNEITNPAVFDQSNNELMDQDNDPSGAYGRNNRREKKDFLKDGLYEWFHTFTLGGSYDMSRQGIPIELNLDYSYTFKYYSDYTSTGNFKPLDNLNYGNEHRHLISLMVTFYP